MSVLVLLTRIQPQVFDQAKLTVKLSSYLALFFVQWRPGIFPPALGLSEPTVSFAGAKQCLVEPVRTVAEPVG